MAEDRVVPEWDGRTLHVRGGPAVPLELRLDGALFARWPAGAARSLRFAFMPGGQPSMQVQMFSADEALHAPLLARWQQAGLEPAPAAPLPLAPLSAVDGAWRLDADTIPMLARRPVSVIVPVYDAPQAFARCLSALRRHTAAPARLLLIDDASPDPGIAPLLAQAARWPNVRVLRNERNRGFTATVNRGLRLCGDDDVVLLNADAEVGPGWLGALRAAAWAAADIASATAVSDNAGAFSVPELEQANPLPPGWTSDDAARALRQQAGLVQPQLPTGNGFCMLLRSDARVRVGELDEQAFPQGYGEENDWSQRAVQRGWRHVVAGNVFVAHARSQSFGDAARLELGEKGMAVLRQRYPDYEAEVGEQLWSFERLVLDWRVRRLWEAQDQTRPLPRLLRVGGSDGGARPWPGWSAWSVLDEGDACSLCDADGAARERAPAVALDRALPAWLQRRGFEAVLAASPGRHGLAETCAALGVPCLPADAEPAALAGALAWPQD
ncbi:MAG TPA: glycosyltransferase [Rhodanobacteraceae bacterium]|nr:glycosyltransferase [Rhodanobacteraceae bacterium]